MGPLSWMNPIVADFAEAAVDSEILWELEQVVDSMELLAGERHET